MKKAHDVYTEAIRDHFKVFYANWPIGEPVALGDYGIMNGRIFIREGNISEDHNLRFETRVDTTEDYYYFKSSDSVALEFFPKGSLIQPGMPRIKASIRIAFDSNEAVFFNAAGVRNHSIESTAKLGETILSMFKEGKWSEKRFILTRLVQADSTTVLISGKSGASVSLEAESEAIPDINLADASIRLSISNDSGVAFNVITKEGYYPMIGISGIKSKRWWLPGSKDEWMPTAKMVYTNIAHIKNEVNNGRTTYDEELYFGDI